MATDPADQPSPASQLTAPRADVDRELASQIAKGHGYRALTATTRDELVRAIEKVRSWSDYNVELLRRRFTTPEHAEAYIDCGTPAQGPYDVDRGLAFLHKQVRLKTDYLARLKDRLVLYEETGYTRADAAETPESSTAKSIFVVHGHDRASEQEVLRFLGDVTDLRPTVLHDQPNRGRTIIEKFEHGAAEAAFAVVLLTGDDEGRSRKETGEAMPRARQNVVFELGFFFGTLGRSRVAALYEPGTELPSDINGIAYIELDRRGAWKNDLFRELKAAGITVHPEALVP